MPKYWEKETDDTIYFWGGIMSNWASYGFEASLRKDAKVVEFNCSEQYMMATKAVVFSDAEALFNIMNSTSPATQKALGRSIVGYSDEVWDVVARDYTYPGVYEKFRQNDEIREVLVSTGNKKIVEASPHDRKWGIGYDHINAEAYYNKNNWGKNWLGQILMEVREDLRTGKDQSFTEIDWTKYE